LLVLELHGRQVRTQPVEEAAGKDGSAILLTLAASGSNLPAIKVDIGYAQLQGFKQAQATAVHERADQPHGILDLGKESSHLVSSQDDRDMDGPLGVYQVSQPFEAAAKDLLKEEQ